MLKKALSLSLVLCGSLFAADNLFEVTPQVGGNFHISNDKFKNNADLTYGLKFANRVTPGVLVEVGYERLDNVDYSHAHYDTDVNRFYMNVVKEFEVWNKVSPYILGGFGYEHISDSLYSVDSAIFGQYGVGLRWEAFENLHLKTELRHLISFDGRSDVVAMLGFSIPFGKFQKEEPQVSIAPSKPEVAPAPTLSHIHTFSVQFPFDSTAINPQYDAEIKDFAEYLKNNPNQTATISGHTDSTGAKGYNQKLSERRATAVKNRIIEHGIDAKRLDAKGYGDSKPVATNATKEGRAKNRRVEAEVYNAN
ncbi:calcium-binding protein [Helicobacter valdiviensis]|uniref:Calcium-binding protein n=1 Tax=Helicobacter valdiviensis TaxID=1458358 RepID=A0A2W6MVL8_9HELI|nr:OmpA family protein [Helicobacter valdiviensis]PZT48392.1 calcium-binding protein [Helicobacter valdiviensis]